MSTNDTLTYNKPPTLHRLGHLVLGALGELSESFEAVLRDHEVGRRKYGRKVGALHSLMLVALCRVLDYNMGAADLLELVSGDAALAMELVVSVAKGAASSFDRA